MSSAVYQFTFSDKWTNTGGAYSGSFTFDGSGIVGIINVVSPFGDATFNTGPNGAVVSEYVSSGNPIQYSISLFDSSPTQSVTLAWQSEDPAYFDSVQYFSPTYSSSAGVDSSYELNGAVTVTPACYCMGTAILTARGEMPVETLAIGNNVITASGQNRPVKWIGRRSYAGRFLAANPGVQPIRFHASSLGDGLPQRDLLVSSEHAMFIEGVLIPARCLVNGSTITRDRGLDRVDYFHVELDTHDILLPEGAPSESFMDDNSRGMFHNAAEFAALYPDAPDSGGFCAPRVESGPELEALRRRLPSTPVHEVSVDQPGVYRVDVPVDALAVRLMTASGFAAGDRRRLGAAISRVVIDGDDTALNDPRLAAGWHQCEGAWRWTDGAGLVVVAGAREIEVTVAALPSAVAA